MQPPSNSPPPTAAIGHFKDTRGQGSIMTNCTMGLFELFFSPFDGKIVRIEYVPRGGGGEGA